MPEEPIFVCHTIREAVQSLGLRLDDGTGVRGDTRPEVGAFLGDGAGDGGSLHLALGVDYHTAVRCQEFGR